MGGNFSNTNQAFDSYLSGGSSKVGEMFDFSLGPVSIYFLESRESRACLKKSVKKSAKTLLVLYVAANVL